jgi:glutamyl-tRNA reductase
VPLVMVGLSHKTAPVEVRERIAFTAPGRLSEALAGLKASGVVEAVLLSTCNRTELYVAGDADPNALLALLSQLHPDAPPELARFCEERRGHRAVEHLFRVTSGLESMVLGESDITRQVKDAYGAAAQAGLTGPTLNPLFHKALEASKRARTELDLSRGAFSVGHAAAQLAAQLFGSLRGRGVLILGAGDMSEATARHLSSAGADTIFVANRTFERAVRLAEALGGRAIDYEAFPAQLAKVDIVVASTSAPRPVVTRELIAATLPARRHRPLFLIDIAVPRDIEAAAGELDDVYLYDIDDLQAVVSAESAARQRRAAKAETLIAREAQLFLEKSRAALAAAPLVTALRARHQAVLESELARLYRRLPELTPDQRAAIEAFGESVLQKIAHDPTRHIRTLAEEQPEKLDTIREVFALSDSPAPSNGGEL